MRLVPPGSMKALGQVRTHTLISSARFLDESGSRVPATAPRVVAEIDVERALGFEPRVAWPHPVVLMVATVARIYRVFDLADAMNFNCGPRPWFDHRLLACPRRC